MHLQILEVDCLHSRHMKHFVLVGRRADKKPGSDRMKCGCLAKAFQAEEKIWQRASV